MKNRRARGTRERRREKQEKQGNRGTRKTGGQVIRGKGWNKGKRGSEEHVNRGNGEQGEIGKQGVLMAQVNRRNKGKGGNRGGQEEQWNRETEQQGNRENRETE